MVSVVYSNMTKLALENYGKAKPNKKRKKRQSRREAAKKVKPRSVSDDVTLLGIRSVSEAIHDLQHIHYTIETKHVRHKTPQSGRSLGPPVVSF